MMVLPAQEILVTVRSLPNKTMKGGDHLNAPEKQRVKRCRGRVSHENTTQSVNQRTTPAAESKSSDRFVWSPLLCDRRLSTPEYDSGHVKMCVLHRMCTRGTHYHKADQFNGYERRKAQKNEKRQRGAGKFWECSKTVERCHLDSHHHPLANSAGKEPKYFADHEDFAVEVETSPGGQTRNDHRDHTVRTSPLNNIICMPCSDPQAEKKEKEEKVHTPVPTRTPSVASLPLPKVKRLAERPVERAQSDPIARSTPNLLRIESCSAEPTVDVYDEPAKRINRPRSEDSKEPISQKLAPDIEELLKSLYDRKLTQGLSRDVAAAHVAEHRAYIVQRQQAAAPSTPQDRIPILKRPQEAPEGLTFHGGEVEAHTVNFWRRTVVNLFTSGTAGTRDGIIYNMLKPFTRAVLSYDEDDSAPRQLLTRTAAANREALWFGRWRVLGKQREGWKLRTSDSNRQVIVNYDAQLWSHQTEVEIFVDIVEILIVHSCYDWAYLDGDGKITNNIHQRVSNALAKYLDKCGVEWEHWRKRCPRIWTNTINYTIQSNIIRNIHVRSILPPGNHAPNFHQSVAGTISQSVNRFSG